MHVVQFVVELGAAITGAYLAFHELQLDCEPVASDLTLVTTIRAAIVVKLVVTALYGIGFSLTMCVSSEATLQSHDQAAEDVDGYYNTAGTIRGWCKALACCCSFEDDDIFNRVGTVMASVFHDINRAGLGASDLGASMLLVRKAQLEQRRSDPHGFALGFMSGAEAAAAPAIWGNHYGEPEWDPQGNSPAGYSKDQNLRLESAVPVGGNEAAPTAATRPGASGGHVRQRQGSYREERASSGAAGHSSFSAGTHPSVVRISKSWVACCAQPPARVPFGGSSRETEQLVRVDSRAELHANRFCRPLDEQSEWEVELLRQQAYYMPYAIAIYGRLLYGFSNGPQALCHPLGTMGCSELASCHGFLGNADQLGPSARHALSSMLQVRRRRRDSGDYEPPGSSKKQAAEAGSHRNGNLAASKTSNRPAADLLPRTGAEADSIARQDGMPLHKFDDCCLCDTTANVLTTKQSPGTVLYASYGGSVSMRPFSVQVDEASRTIVVSVRGTLSAEDVLVDADAEPFDIRDQPEVRQLTRPSHVSMESPTGEQAGGAAPGASIHTVQPLLSETDLVEGVYVHRSMWLAARNIANVIEEECLLAAAAGVDLQSGDAESGDAPASASSAAGSNSLSSGTEKTPMAVLVVGHSLGAGVTQMLTIILRVSTLVPIRSASDLGSSFSPLSLPVSASPFSSCRQSTHRPEVSRIHPQGGACLPTLRQHLPSECSQFASFQVRELLRLGLQSGVLNMLVRCCFQPLLVLC